MLTPAQRFSAGEGVDALFRTSGRPFSNTYLILIPPETVQNYNNAATKASEFASSGDINRDNGTDLTRDICSLL